MNVETRISAFEFIAGNDDCCHGDPVIIEERAVGGACVFEPPLSMVVCYAGVIGGERFVCQRDIAMFTAPNQDLALPKTECGFAAITHRYVKMDTRHFF